MIYTQALVFFFFFFFFGYIINFDFFFISWVLDGVGYPIN